MGKAPHDFAVTYADTGGSGVDPASVKVTIDGIDRSAEFVAGPARATAHILTQLSNGTHALVATVLDWAGNQGTATSTFIVDAVDPVVNITTPTANVWLKGPTISVTGTVTDASPTSVQVNGLDAGVTSSFSISVPATDGVFVINVVARDAAGNGGTSAVTVAPDVVVPVEQPPVGVETRLELDDGRRAERLPGVLLLAGVDDANRSPARIWLSAIR